MKVVNNGNIEVILYYSLQKCIIKYCTLSIFSQVESINCLSKLLLHNGVEYASDI